MNEQVKGGEGAKPRLLRATVAGGRTVAVPHPTNRKPVGTTPEGKAITQAELVHYGPGQEVELPVDEIARLRGTGHLVDPDRPVYPLATSRSAAA